MRITQAIQEWGTVEPVVTQAVVPVTFSMIGVRCKYDTVGWRVVVSDHQHTHTALGSWEWQS